MQYHHKDLPPMRHRILRRHLWSHSCGQQLDGRTAEKHLWLLLCAGTAVPLDATGPVASHHAWRILLGSPLWCVGEILHNDTAICPQTALQFLGLLGICWSLPQGAERSVIRVLESPCWMHQEVHALVGTHVCMHHCKGNVALHVPA